jgi:hypothetical protein
VRTLVRSAAFIPWASPPLVNIPKLLVELFGIFVIRLSISITSNPRSRRPCSGPLSRKTRSTPKRFPNHRPHHYCGRGGRLRWQGQFLRRRAKRSHFHRGKRRALMRPGGHCRACAEVLEGRCPAWVRFKLMWQVVHAGFLKFSANSRPTADLRD